MPTSGFDTKSKSTALVFTTLKQHDHKNIGIAFEFRKREVFTKLPTWVLGTHGYHLRIESRGGPEDSCIVNGGPALSLLDHINPSILPNLEIELCVKSHK